MVSDEVDNVRRLLEVRADASPSKEFLFSYPDGRVLTYREFDRTVDDAAGLLMSRGVGRRDRVSLFLNNRAEYLIFYFACFKIGAWAGPVNASLKAKEVEFVIGYSDSVVVVTQDELVGTLSEALPVLPSVKHIIIVGNEKEQEISDGGDRPLPPGPALIKYDIFSVTGLPSEPPRDSDLSAGDEAVIIYTSGTTGKPKGVLLTHGNLLSNAEQIACWLRLTADDRSLIMMPLFHVNALMTTGLAALWAGASIVISPRFTASRHWEIVSTYGITYFGSVATMLSMLNNAHPGGIPPDLDMSKLRFALCGSAPVPVEVVRQFESLFRCPVIEGYGLSESTCRSTFNPIDNRRPGSIGLPIGNEVKIFDEADSELAPRQLGEIVLRGPNIMKGYYKDPIATEEVFRSGWLHTGDLGYSDEDGFFYIVDRKSDMIIRGGENIYPREIDGVLYEHPKVKEAATIGIPDPLYGEEVRSFVVLRDGMQSTEEELIEYCRQRLADYKCPSRIRFLDDIPKGPTGKLLKRHLSKLQDPVKR